MGYPTDLPAYVPPPAPAAPPAPAPAARSTYDTIKQRSNDIMSKVDQAVRGTTNPANALPTDAFHKPQSR